MAGGVRVRAPLRRAAGLSLQRAARGRRGAGRARADLHRAARRAGDELERADPRGRLVQARNEVELAASGLEEAPARHDADLLERLEAVADEARAHHIGARRA